LAAETTHASYGPKYQIGLIWNRPPISAGIIGHALAGNRNADDEEMLTLLAPYEGQRHRATRLILLSGHTPSRRAPRMTRGDIARL
ncbi:DNA-3-methyladenine glycosylase 2 family protein, partial [Micromonospora matsumotoense]